MDRGKITKALKNLGCEETWLNQFKTIDLKEMLDKILFRNKKENSKCKN